MAVALRIVVIANTTLPSRDCIVFVRYALDLEDPPSTMGSIIGVIKANEHPPGYPLAILAASKVVRQFTGGETVPTMALSAQIASALAGVLLTIPLYLLSRRLLDRNSAFAATAVFGVLPGFVEVTSDGISDGLFLLTAVTALWFAVRALRPADRRSARQNGFAAGVCCGLGSLVRPESHVVALSVGLTLIGIIAAVWLRRNRQAGVGDRIRPRIQAGLGLIAGWAIVALPYMALIGGVTNKPSGKALFEREPDPTYFNSQSRAPAVHLPLAAWYDPVAFQGQNKALWAFKNLGAEYLKAAHYVVPAFGLIGLFALRRRLTDPRLAMLLLLCALLAALLWFLAWHIGYVSQRHTLLIVMVTCIFTAAGFHYLARLAIGAWQTEAVSRRTVRFLEPLAGRGGGDAFVRGMRGVNPWMLVAIWVAIVMAVAVPRNFKSLHEERAGHKLAGLWMKDNVPPDWQIVDPFGWAEWYTGRTLRAIPNPDPSKCPGVYAVFEPNAKSPHSRLGYYEMAKNLVAPTNCAVMVFQYPEGVPPDEIKVAVYRCLNPAWKPSAK